jgi:uncharacterized protein (TIGR03067 family)
MDDRRSPSGRPCVPERQEGIGDMKSLMCMTLLFGAATALALPPLPWTDKARLQGQWVVVSGQDHGQPTEQLNGSVYIFEGDKLTIRSPYFDLEPKPYHLTTGKEPAQIDIEVAPSRMIRGIYKVRGDELTLCTGNFAGTKDELGHLVAQPGQRPTTFDSRYGELVVLRRRNPPPAPPAGQPGAVPEREGGGTAGH